MFYIFVIFYTFTLHGVYLCLFLNTSDAILPVHLDSDYSAAIGCLLLARCLVRTSGWVLHILHPILVVGGVFLPSLRPLGWSFGKLWRWNAWRDGPSFRFSLQTCVLTCDACHVCAMHPGFRLAFQASFVPGSGSHMQLSIIYLCTSMALIGPRHRWLHPGISLAPMRLI